MDKRWNLMVVTLVALSAIVMGTACAVETMIIGPSGEVTDAVAQLPCGTVAHQVNIFSGYWMNKLEMVVKTPNEATQSLGVHGYAGGGPSTFTLADGEYITEVSGDFTPTDIWAPSVLYSIEFTTNLGNTYGPYGAAGGTLEDQYPGLSPFDYVAPDGWQILGFTTTQLPTGPFATIGVIATPVPECCNDVQCRDNGPCAKCNLETNTCTEPQCCNNVDCQATHEDAPCVKCDLKTNTCIAPGVGNPHKMCDDTCVNTQNDVFNCGDCGKECNTDAGQKCVNGVCKGKKV